MSDHYRTLAEPAEFRQKIERSEFLALAFPCESDDRFFSSLQEIEKRHFDASHHCWAFRLFANARHIFSIDVRRSRAGDLERALTDRRLRFSRTTPP